VREQPQYIEYVRTEIEDAEHYDTSPGVSGKECSCNDRREPAARYQNQLSLLIEFILTSFDLVTLLRYQGKATVRVSG
jgi:hypothetical protein